MPTDNLTVVSTRTAATMQRLRLKLWQRQQNVLAVKHFVADGTVTGAASASGRGQRASHTSHNWSSADATAPLPFKHNACAPPHFAVGGVSACAKHWRPLSVRRYFCRRLLGLSGIVYAIKSATKAGVM